ncbi:AMP-binding protein [Nannocystis punicea]|uniref:AMP-binding protein n=1 Tax=Nannocystis punicea TaxID=2995304 RepID=A0ABY7GUM2_9BACT|nr:AMP-binding protein [Nannocystis poenicansa]WAS90651.1 AMP-binding protein [Nannocystis poenicansa]
MSHDESHPIALPAAVLELSVGLRTDFPRDRSIAEMFEEQVRRAPDAIAVRFEGRETSYRELNRRANRLARRLRAGGVGVDTPVGILIDQSPAVVVAFIAILKAGGAYVPLDPLHPASRLARMIEDARPTVLLGSREAAAQFGFTGDCIEYPGAEDDPPTDAGDDVDVSGGAGPEDVAHVLFTSGSTGRPKGACVLHRGVLRLVVDTDWIRLGPDDRVAQVASFSFDIPTIEVVPERERAPRRPTGRRKLPEHLPRVDIEELPPEVQQEGLAAFKRIGEEVSEVIERRPESLVVVRLVRPKFVRIAEDIADASPVKIAEPPAGAFTCRAVGRRVRRATSGR